MPKRKISVVLICLILLSVLTVRGQFVEGKEIQRDNNNESLSLSEQEIVEEVNKKTRSSFLENQGQVGNEDVVFYGSIPNGRIAFGESKVMLWMEGMNSFVTLNFVGAREVSPIGVNELVTKSNYFLGDRGAYTSVRSFGAIIYYDLWKGIDLYYQATSKGAKYEFRVDPGANPGDISINCQGQEQLIISDNSLTILKGNGRFVDEGLKVFQGESMIDARFISKGDNTYEFKISKYNQFKPLIIDPLIYSTFVGGSNYDRGQSIVVDSEGNTYVTGWTISNDFPTTTNAYNKTYGGGTVYGDCFVFKLSADGSSLLYSTFIGGNESDYGDSITIDSEGNAYVTGYTQSNNFPTTLNAYNQTHSGDDDCFVFKLSTDGSSLLYSTLIGGSDEDSGDMITIDSEKNAYVTGHTASNVFPTTSGAYDESYNGGSYDCFVFKLSADGSNLLYSTFIGGNQQDYGSSIVLDGEGNTCVTGVTWSTNFPTTEGAYNRTYDYIDCFVFKLSADGSSLLYSTFVGGSNGDWGNSIVLDMEGNAYITGGTSSFNFPTTENAYSRAHGGGSDCFVFKLSADGSSLLYSTFMGGNSSDLGISIILDSEGNAYVTGYTQSTNFPTTKNAYDTSYNGDRVYQGDCYVFKLSADGSFLLYSTFIGGKDGDRGNSIVLDDEDNVYVTGYTYSSDFPTTTGVYDDSPNYVGEIMLFSDCFVFKLPIEDAPKRLSLILTISFSIAGVGGIIGISIIIIRKRKRK